MTVKVKNRSDSGVGYYLPEDRITRNFTPNETKTIKKEELEKLVCIPGGKTILQDYLLINDREFVKSLDLAPEQEYWMNEEEIKVNMMQGSLDLFLDMLDFAPEGVKDLIKKLAVEIPLMDYNKLEALKKATGFDAAAATKNLRVSEEDKKEEVAPKRRVQIDVPVEPKVTIIKK